ncbi:hypothetical protein MTO96_040368 [Rhipicephalus appendiculatus]
MGTACCYHRLSFLPPRAKGPTERFETRARVVVSVPSPRALARLPSCGASHEDTTAPLSTARSQPLHGWPYTTCSLSDSPQLPSNAATARAMAAVYLLRYTFTRVAHWERADDVDDRSLFSR